MDTHTIVIGAGAAGLAVAACLQRKEIPFIVLERDSRPGSAWRRRYDRLHLHTHRRFSALPYLPFPQGTPRYPSRRQVATYLEAYAQSLGIAPRFGQEVSEARPLGEGWRVATRDTEYRSRCLVIATGHNHTPHRPEWPGMATFPGSILHSSEYANGSVFGGCRALVVGFGNSGAEIALDLHEHGATVAVAIRSPVNVAPRDVFGMSSHMVAVMMSGLPAGVADALTGSLPRLIFGDLSRYGLKKPPYGNMTQVERFGSTPLLDIGTIDLIKQGAVAVYPGLSRFEEGTVGFEDGRRAAFDAVVLATGYRQNLGAFLQDCDTALDAEGKARTSGEEAGVPGLYFCGFRNARGGLLREAGREAERIAAHIASAHLADRHHRRNSR